MFPTLRQAARHIAYDNGAVNRDCTERTAIDESMDRAQRICGRAMMEIAELELSSLSHTELYNACCGEGGEQSVSDVTDKVLNALFDGVD